MLNATFKSHHTSKIKRNLKRAENVTNVKFGHGITIVFKSVCYSHDQFLDNKLQYVNFNWNNSLMILFLEIFFEN